MSSNGPGPSETLMESLLGKRPESPAQPLQAPSEHRLTARQQAFQVIAIRMEEGGSCFIRDWLKESRHTGEHGLEPVTMSEWKTWSKVDGFHAAFYGGFPLGRDIVEDDLKGMDVQFWEQLREGVKAGNMRSLELFAKIRGLAKDTDGDISIGIQAILGDVDSTKWRKKRVGVVEIEAQPE